MFALVSKADAKRLPSEGLRNTSPESKGGAIQKNNHTWFRKLKGKTGRPEISGLEDQQ